MARGARILAVLLALSLLAGCAGFFGGDPGRWGGMVYERPDREDYEDALESAMTLAQGTSVDALSLALSRFYRQYDWIWSNEALSYIHYCMDLTDSHWQEEHEYCAALGVEADQGLQSLYYALAKSPLRDQMVEKEMFTEDFFLAYEGDDPYADPQVTDLLEQEQTLVNRYYELSQGEGTELYSREYYETCAPRLAELYAQLVAVRQEIAAVFGYETYSQFAYDTYHYRDYTPLQAEAYLTRVGAALGPLYRDLESLAAVWAAEGKESTPKETLAYLRSSAKAMGGELWRVEQQLEKQKLYEIVLGEDRMDVAFELYVWSHEKPFVYLGASGTVLDRLSMTHEFGHFAADYLCQGSVVGTDVAEVQSQTMEYLSLIYAEDGEQLRQLKLADSLCNYVEQSFYGLFEHRVYALAEPTAQSIEAVYLQTAREFGMEGLEPLGFVDVYHFYEEPLYVVSYVLSNDLAMQVYERELENRGAGLELYEACLRSDESYILTFAQTYELQSPFAPERLDAVVQLFREALE